MKSLTVLLVPAVCALWLGAARGVQAASGDGLVDEHELFGVVGAMHDIDPDLLEAIAKTESNNNPRAVSDKGAKGLMQLMPATALRFDVVDPFDPIDNALGAARFLDYLRNLTGGDLPKTLAAYNAGEGAVRHHRGIPPYPETREYVRTVLWLYLLGSPSSERSNSNRHPVHNSVSTHKVVSNGPLNGDDAVLEQLSVLKRNRAAAAQVR